MRDLLFIGLGGALGAIFRYGITLWTSHIAWFRIGIGALVANVIGCLIFGLVLAFVEKGIFKNSGYNSFFLVGFCGGLTTFSSYIFTLFVYSSEGNMIKLVSYAFFSIILSLLAFLIGFKIVSQFNV